MIKLFSTARIIDELLLNTFLLLYSLLILV